MKKSNNKKKPGLHINSVRCRYVPNYLLCTSLIVNCGQTGIFGKAEMLCISLGFIFVSCVFFLLLLLLNTLSNMICELTSSFGTPGQAPRRCRQRLGGRFHLLEVACFLLCSGEKTLCFAQEHRAHTASGLLLRQQLTNPPN